ncbi:uncharacterized protein J4E87_003279 [Alternaria ethzedia]|uniref:uncharacterized protein n=1 Tax=Alternaria ethzedia TaxID=181014 RepID=UPI0020C586EA|nr:uncharacterized protein J4E87_003279 [Alternaria ethzedia]KAI4629019.1 hypothetical protein J4E87_003279 [Alternaria ethzedia]
MTRSELEDLYSIVVTAERDTNVGMMMDESPEKILLIRVGIALGLLLSPDHSFTEVLITELTTKAAQLMPRILNQETVPNAVIPDDLLKDQLHASGLAEIIKCPGLAQDPGRDMMLRHIEEHFVGYAASVEHQLTGRERASGALDGYLIFFIGLFIASLPPTQERQRCVLQCLSSLTVLSIHYTALQGFRNILMAIQSRPSSHEHLKSLVAASEIAVSCHVRRLIFGSV